MRSSPGARLRLQTTHAFVGSKVEEIILRYTMNQPISCRKGVFESIRREICRGDANSSAHKISVMHKQIHKAGQPRSLVKEADSLAMVAAGEGPQYDMNTIDEFSRIIDEAIRTYFDRESV